MRFLVDANVLSEATKAQPDARVVAWLAAHETELAINPIILGELRFGIVSLPRGKRRSKLIEWLESGVRYLAMLNMDAETASHWAQLLTDLKNHGRAMPIKDSLIAATALQFSLPIATRNTKDFSFTDVELVNPCLG